MSTGVFWPLFCTFFFGRVLVHTLTNTLARTKKSTITRRIKVQSSLYLTVTLGRGTGEIRGLSPVQVSYDLLERVKKNWMVTGLVIWMGSLETRYSLATKAHEPVQNRLIVFFLNFYSNITKYLLYIYVGIHGRRNSCPRSLIHLFATKIEKYKRVIIIWLWPNIMWDKFFTWKQLSFWVSKSNWFCSITVCYTIAQKTRATFSSN